MGYCCTGVAWAGCTEGTADDAETGPVSGEPLHSDQARPATTITAMRAIQAPTGSRYELVRGAGLNYD
jgi:hypothetical protein